MTQEQETSVELSCNGNIETELLINKFKAYFFKAIDSESEINNLIDSILNNLSKLKISEQSELKFQFSGRIALVCFYY